MTPKENVLQSAKSCQVFINAEKQGASGENVGAEAGLSGEDKKASSIMYSREQVNHGFIFRISVLEIFSSFLLPF